MSARLLAFFLAAVPVGDASKAARVLSKFTKKPIVTVDQDGN